MTVNITVAKTCAHEKNVPGRRIDDALFLLSFQGESVVLNVCVEFSDSPLKSDATNCH